MSTQQEATFTGTEMKDVRPGAIIGLAATDAITKGQAHVYEVLTGLAAPGAATLVATGHQHDSEGSGAPIRVPLAQGTLDVVLRGRDPDDITVTPGWQKFLDTPFFVPAGFTEVSIVLCGDGALIPQSVRAVTEDASLVENEEPVPFSVLSSRTGRRTSPHHFSSFSSQVFEARVAVTPGEYNVLRLEAWAGKSLPSASNDDEGPFMQALPRTVHSWHVLPVDQAPTVRPLQAAYPEDGVQQLARSALLTFDSSQGMASDGLDAFLLQRLGQNDGLLRELCTGRAAGNAEKAQRQLLGHQHVDDGENDLDDSGLLVDMSLGTWSYGVVRRVHTSDPDRPSADEVASSSTGADTWTGRIFAPVLGATTANITAAKHLFRLPAVKRSHLTGTSKVKFAVLLWKGDSSVATVGVRISDDDEGNPDTESPMSTAASGRVLVTGTVDAEVDGAAFSTQSNQKAMVRLRIQSAVAKSKNLAIYGMALALDAS